LIVPTSVCERSDVQLYSDHAIHVEDLEKALIFLNAVLSFETQFRARDYAYIHREAAGMRILQQKGADAAPPSTRRFAYYVRDVPDQLYAELKPKLDTLPTCDVYGPVNQPYGERELLVLAPDGNLIVFGQAIETAKA
jgi:hypothetical protein